MRMRQSLVLGAMVMLWSHPTYGQVVGTDRAAAVDTLPFCCTSPKPLPAAAELASLIVVPWYFNRHVGDDVTAALSLTSWRQNVERGFEWDPNAFTTNLFLHPYHGAAFFATGRSNGYNFWQSSVFSMAGSFLWEFFGENNRPAINDLINTGMGGTALGEGLHRTAKLVLDNTASGAGRAGREIGAFFINPVGGFNRAVRGEMSRRGPNPADRLPTGFSMFSQIGYRYVGVERLDNRQGKGNAYVDALIRFGNPATDFRRPFDSFVLAVQLNTDEKEVLGRLQIEGTIWGTPLNTVANPRLTFVIFQHYDYVNNETYEAGGQSASIGLASHLALGNQFAIRSRLHLLGVVISGIKSDFANFPEVAGRDYDFGSGFGIRVGVALTRFNNAVISSYYAGHLSFTMNGTAGRHSVHFFRTNLQVPVWRSFGAGVEFIVSARNSLYRDFPAVHRLNPQLRAYIAAFTR